MNKAVRFLKKKLGKRKTADVYPLRIFKEFEDSLSLIEDFDHIAGNFLGKIKEACPVQRLVLIIYDADTGKFKTAASSGIENREMEPVSLSRSSRLVKWLKINQTFLHIPRNTGVLEYLSQKEVEMFEALEIEICFPLMSMNRLIGILFVGSKANRQPFGKLDIALISNFLPQTGIALENALLFKEQRERLRRMSRADKLATIGELAAGAAHEIRNPLTSIKSSLQYLESKGADETSKKLLSSAIQETRRIDEIVSALLSFSRPTEIHKVRHDVRETLEESLELVSFQAKTQNVRIIKDFTTTSLLVQGDRSQLKQLFLNIFLNSIQAMPDGGEMKVETLLKNGRKAVVAVSDSGPGIPEKNLDRIFDPFFTTKKGGTGLGLSICYNIAKSHQGEIEVRSKAGQGTTTIITLPALN